MKTMYLFREAPLYDRLSVYDNYVYDADERGVDHVDFEEFDYDHRNESFYSVAHRYA